MSPLADILDARHKRRLAKLAICGRALEFFTHPLAPLIRKPARISFTHR